MPLTDDEMEAMAATLCNKTQLGRLTHPEIVTVLRFMEGEGMLVDPHPPEIVGLPLETVINAAISHMDRREDDAAYDVLKSVADS